MVIIWSINLTILEESQSLIGEYTISGTIKIKKKSKDYRRVNISSEFVKKRKKAESHQKRNARKSLEINKK
jgi:hypothetical protein